MKLSLFKKAVPDPEFAAMVAESDLQPLTDASFDEAIKASPRVVVDFWASWCVPCKILSRQLLELEAEYRDRVVFATVDADAEPGLRKRNHVWGLPTLLLFRDGRQVGKMTGTKGPADLRKRLDELVAEG